MSVNSTYIGLFGALDYSSYRIPSLGFKTCPTEKAGRQPALCSSMFPSFVNMVMVEYSELWLHLLMDHEPRVLEYPMNTLLLMVLARHDYA